MENYPPTERKNPHILMDKSWNNNVKVVTKTYVEYKQSIRLVYIPLNLNEIQKTTYFKVE